MKRFLTIVFALLLVLFVSCTQESVNPEPQPQPATDPVTDPDPVVKEYKIGDRGPAGGYIFYDCDADNDKEYNDGLNLQT